MTPCPYFDACLISKLRIRSSDTGVHLIFSRKVDVTIRYRLSGFITIFLFLLVLIFSIHDFQLNGPIRIFMLRGIP